MRMQILYLKRYQLFKVFISLILLYLGSFEARAEFKVTVHKVGSGNCVAIESSKLVEARSTEDTTREEMIVDSEPSASENNSNKPPQPTTKKEYMLVDCGSNTSREYSKLNANVSSQDELQRQPSVLGETFESRGDEASDEEKAENDKKIAANIRESLGCPKQEGGNKCQLHIKSLFITHPDQDHYNWIINLRTNDNESKIFKEGDQIDYIVLGSEHNSDVRPYTRIVNALKEILGEGKIGTVVRLDKRQYSYKKDTPESEVSLEELSKQSLKALVDTAEVQKDETPEKSAEYNTLNNLFLKHYSDSMQVEGEEINEPVTTIYYPIFTSQGGVDFLSFSEGHNTQVSLLGVNPSDTSDANDDSLILKFQNKVTQKSFLLTGDATCKTTLPLLESFPTSIFKATVFLADHHGANTRGSNDQLWIQAISPSWVFFSAGAHGSYFHPTREVYDRFKEFSPNLSDANVSDVPPGSPIKPTNWHKMLTGRGKNWLPSETARRFLSTVANGTLMAKFLDNAETPLKIFAMVYEGDTPIEFFNDNSDEGVASIGDKAEVLQAMQGRCDAASSGNSSNTAGKRKQTNDEADYVPSNEESSYEEDSYDEPIKKKSKKRGRKGNRTKRSNKKYKREKAVVPDPVSY